VQALRVFAQHHVRSPAPAANQDVLTVDVEGAAAARIDIGSDVANPELRVRTITDSAIDFKLHSKRIEIRLAHLRRPPQPRIRKDKLRKLLRRESDVCRFVGRKLDILLERNVFDLPSQFAFEGMVSSVFSAAP